MNRSTFIAICLTGIATIARAQSAISLPQVGQALDRSGVLRPVHGIAGNFLLGDPAATDILSAGCGPDLCLFKADDQLLVLPVGAVEPTAIQTPEPLPAGSAIFAFRDHSAWIYFPQTSTLTHFTTTAEPATTLQLNGEVLSMRATAKGLEFAARRDGTVWIEDLNGSVIDSLPDADGPVLLLDNSIVYRERDAVKIKPPNANVIEFALPGVVQISQLSPRYAQITTADHVYALKLDAGSEALSQLPDPPAGITRTVRRR